MDEIIVLGLIPGTHIQITFVAWLIVASTLLTIIILRASTRTQLFRAWVIATSILLQVQRRELA
jgi:hypothetical protein